MDLSKNKTTIESLACRYWRRWRWGLTSRGRQGGGKSILKNASNWALRNQDRSSNTCECLKRHGNQEKLGATTSLSKSKKMILPRLQITERFQQDCLECNGVLTSKSIPIYCCCTEMQWSLVFKFILFPLNVFPNLTHISAKKVYQALNDFR